MSGTNENSRTRKVIEPAKWRAEFDENGDPIDVYYDESFRRLIGSDEDADPSEVYALWLKKIHPDDARRLNLYLLNCSAKHPEGMDYDIEYRMLTRGGYRLFHDHAFCTRREDGSLASGDGVIFDIQDIVDTENDHRVLAEKYSRLMMHEDDYEVLFDVELETGKYETVVKGKRFGRVSGKLTSSGYFLDDIIRNNEIVHPDDRQGNIDVVQPEYIRRALSREEHFDRFYRIMDGDQPVWVRMRVTYKDPEKKNIIIRVYNAENAVEAQQISEQNEKLESQQKLLKEQLVLSDGLAREYHTVFTIEGTDTHRMRLYRTTGKKTIRGAIQIALNDPDYDRSIVRYIRGYIHEDDQERVLEATKYETVERETPEFGTYVVSYKRFAPEQKGFEYHQMVFARAETEEGKRNYILAFRDADSLLREQIAQKNQLQEALTFTRFFLDTYVSAYYINLKDRSYKVFTRKDELDRNYPGLDDYFKSVCSYVERDVHPDDRKELKEILSPKFLKKTLKTTPEIAHFYRDISNGIEKTYRVQIIQGADKDHAAFGFVDVTEEVREQQKRILGALPLSNDVLSKANIGLWAFEMDEGKPPRMYVDETMLGLIGLTEQISPEETYHVWYDHIDASSLDLVSDAVEKMTNGEHAEVQYPWIKPDGRTIMVRCGGVRNYEYTKGIRIEGTHQDVTQTLHFDEKERERAKQLEKDLEFSKLRADALAYIADNDPDYDDAVKYFGNRILELSDCSRVVFREINGKSIVFNAPGISDMPLEICSDCPFYDPENSVYSDDGIIAMTDCRKGYKGVRTAQDCPARSAFIQRVTSGGELVGLFTFYYLDKQHVFTDSDISIMKSIALYLGLMFGRIKEKQSDIARIKAESSNRAKTEFLFNMSHDIRTPMNAILGYTDIALNHVDETERVQDSLEKIKTSGSHLLSLINDILEMSRIEAGRMEIAENPVEIYAVVEDIVTMSQALASTKDITFKSRVGKLQNNYVYADKLHTNQVVINLISNAIKYTKPGGTVKYSIEQLNEPEDGIAVYRIVVKDNGIGMSREFQKHLFESFSREQTATVSKQEGAGLGLAIVKNIVDLIGGSITVKSEQNKGTTMTVDLPMRVMDEDAVREYEASKLNTYDVGEDISFEGSRILLVEDNELNREIAREMLEDTGMIIETAEDGALAVKYVIEKGVDYYDFILMDIQMPVMGGYEATAEIRSLTGGDRIPIIALSANAFKEDVDKSLKAGMNDHVAKPIDPAELFKAMAKVKW